MGLVIIISIITQSELFGNVKNKVVAARHGHDDSVACHKEECHGGSGGHFAVAHFNVEMEWNLRAMMILIKSSVNCLTCTS